MNNDYKRALLGAAAAALFCLPALAGADGLVVLGRTLYSVAGEAGVSIGTVSRVLGGTAKVRSNTFRECSRSSRVALTRAPGATGARR